MKKINIYVVFMVLMTVTADIAHIASTIQNWKVDPVYGLWMIAVFVAFNFVMTSLTMTLFEDEEES